jgi:hypothetical protein
VSASQSHPSADAGTHIPRSPEPLKPSEVLAKAADLIEPEGAWTQYQYARTKRGAPIGPCEEPAVCWCVKGAILRVVGDKLAAGPLWIIAAQHITRSADDGRLARWNDAGGRKQATVVAALRKASALEQAEGQ